MRNRPSLYSLFGKTSNNCLVENNFLFLFKLMAISNLGSISIDQSIKKV